MLVKERWWDDNDVYESASTDGGFIWRQEKLLDWEAMMGYQSATKPDTVRRHDAILALTVSHYDWPFLSAKELILSQLNVLMVFLMLLEDNVVYEKMLEA